MIKRRQQNQNEQESLSSKKNLQLQKRSAINQYAQRIPQQNNIIPSQAQQESLVINVRIRPLLQSQHEQVEAWSVINEQGYNQINSIESNNKRKYVEAYNQYSFNFDKVYLPSDSTEHVYKSSCKQLVNCIFQGINSTVLMYGATASGKTFSMIGDIENPGILPFSLLDIFEEIQLQTQQNSNVKFKTAISYIEIYNEQINDLLNPQGQNLKIVEDPQYGIIAQNMKVWEVGTFEEAIMVLKMGEEQRSYKETHQHEHSSRSHTIFQFRLIFQHQHEQSNEQEEAQVSTAQKYALLNLVDLAGSEKSNNDDYNYNCNNDQVEYHQSTKAETNYINKSLLVLSNVINRLAIQQSGNNSKATAASQYIPYRDSKLTRMLQNSLGGNAKTTIICTISPSSLKFHQSLSTLRFADRAKLIKNMPFVNEVPIAQSQGKTTQIIKQLKQENENLVFERTEKEQIIHNLMLMLEQQNLTLKQNTETINNSYYKMIAQNIQSCNVGDNTFLDWQVKAEELLHQCKCDLMIVEERCQESIRQLTLNMFPGLNKEPFMNKQYLSQLQQNKQFQQLELHQNQIQDQILLTSQDSQYQQQDEQEELQTSQQQEQNSFLFHTPESLLKLIKQGSVFDNINFSAKEILALPQTSMLDQQGQCNVLQQSLEETANFLEESYEHYRSCLGQIFKHKLKMLDLRFQQETGQNSMHDSGNKNGNKICATTLQAQNKKNNILEVTEMHQTELMSLHRLYEQKLAQLQFAIADQTQRPVLEPLNYVNNQKQVQSSLYSPDSHNRIESLTIDNMNRQQRLLSKYLSSECIQQKQQLQSENISPISIIETNKKIQNLKTQTFAWGLGKEGQLGNGSCKDQENAPQQIKNFDSFKQVSAGSHHSAGLDANGDVFTWGKNTMGQLGHGQYTDINIPLKIQFTNFQKITVKHVACGWQHTIMLTVEGSLYSCGNGDKGQLGHGNKLACPSPKQIAQSLNQQFKFKTVAAGHSHSAAITEEGSLVYMWGENTDFRLSVRSDQKNVLIPTKSELHFAFPNEKATYVSLGINHTAIITCKLYTCGNGSNGQLGVNLHTQNVSVAYVANTEDDSNIDFNRVNNNNNVNQTAGQKQLCSILQYVSTFGENQTMDKAVQVACGESFTVVLNNRGKLFTFGKASSKVLGQSNLRPDHIQYEPKIIEECQELFFIDIAAGKRHVCAIEKNGHLYSWGYNQFQQLGLTENQDIKFPTMVKLKAALKVIQVSCGEGHTLSVTTAHNQ